MKRLLIAMLVGLVGACGGQPLPVEGALDPAAETAPIAMGIGVLRPDFDVERAAPATASNGSGHHHHDNADEATASEYTCPHHPEVKSDKPGKCPKCGMDLEPKPAPKSNDADDGGHGHGDHH